MTSGLRELEGAVPEAFFVHNVVGEPATAQWKAAPVAHGEEGRPCWDSPCGQRRDKDWRLPSIAMTYSSWAVGQPA
jgi:hypothetical protein